MTPTVADPKLKSFQTPLDKKLENSRLVSLREAARLRGVSVDTLKRNHGDKIVRLSKRQLGMQLKDALQLGDEEGEAA